MCGRKDRVSNCYHPSFLCMEVETNDDLQQITDALYPPQTEAAFLHEYIHYIQDLTTTSGLARIGSICDKMRWAILDAKNTRHVTIPINPSNVNDYNIGINHRCSIINSGDNKHRDINNQSSVIANIVNWRIENVVERDNAGKPYTIERLVVTFGDDNGNAFDYQVGDMAISESMAYMIESSIYPNALPSPPDCPYRIVQKLVEHFSPTLNDIDKMVALCDISLMSTFPGKTLYKAIEYVNNHNSTPTAEEMYTVVMPSLLPPGWDMAGYWGYLKSVSNTAAQQMSSYFNMSPQLQSNLLVANRILNNAYLLRKHDMNFILRILRGGNISNNNAFKQIFKEYLGCLCTLTDIDEVHSLVPNFEYSEDGFGSLQRTMGNNIACKAEFMVVLRILHDIFFSNAAIQNNPRFGQMLMYECPLKASCSKAFRAHNINDITHEYQSPCQFSPWENAQNGNAPLCSFAQIWNVYGLTGININI